MMDFIFLILGLVVLTAGGEFLVKGAVNLAKKYKIPSLVIGLTVVALGTSMPELFTSINALLEGHSDISIANVIGSNICNIALVLGLTALVFPIIVERQIIRNEWGFMMLISCILFVFMFTQNALVWWEGILFLVALFSYMGWQIYAAKRENQSAVIEATVIPDKQSNNVLLSIFFIALGVLGLAFGSTWFINGAVGIARLFEVSERIIGLSLVAFGTSVPEIVASMIAAFRKESDMSIGNILGSNIFNILGVLGATSLFDNISISQQMLHIDIIWMLGITLFLLPLIYFRSKIGRLEGFLLLSLYVVYMVVIY